MRSAGFEAKSIKGYILELNLTKTARFGSVCLISLTFQHVGCYFIIYSFLTLKLSGVAEMYDIGGN